MAGIKLAIEPKITIAMLGIHGSNINLVVWYRITVCMHNTYYAVKKSLI